MVELHSFVFELILKTALRPKSQSIYLWILHNFNRLQSLYMNILLSLRFIKFGYFQIASSLSLRQL